MKIIYLTLVSLVCCQQHQIKTINSLSRLITTIQFSSSNKPYIANEDVGGEQINSTIIKALKNDSYIIEVQTNNQSLDIYIDGSSLNITSLDNARFKKQVTATVQTDITISISSHPQSSSYQLKIIKQNN